MLRRRPRSRAQPCPAGDVSLRVGTTGTYEIRFIADLIKRSKANNCSKMCRVHHQRAGGPLLLLLLLFDAALTASPHRHKQTYRERAGRMRPDKQINRLSTSLHYQSGTLTQRRGQQRGGEGKKNPKNYINFKFSEERKLCTGILLIEDKLGGNY